MTEIYDQKIESVLDFAVRNRGATGKQYQEKFWLDFSEFKGHTQIGKRTLHTIAQHLEKIQKDFHRFAKGSCSGGVRVVEREDLAIPVYLNQRSRLRLDRNDAAHSVFLHIKLAEVLIDASP